MSIETNRLAGTAAISYYGKHLIVQEVMCESCLKYKKNGFNESGVYTIYPPGHPSGLLVFCDMETDGGGWTLVASWDNASEWTKDSISTGDPFLEQPKNAFSSNFGNTLVKQLRVTVSNEIDSEKFADFKYNWSEEVSWKEIWSPKYGRNEGYMSSTPRQSLKMFNSATNIKLGYTTGQRWANMCDWNYRSGLRGDTANWWKGLTEPGETLGFYNQSKYYATTGDVSDGSFAIAAVNRTDNSGQDTYWNTKIGYDDGRRYIGIGQNRYSNSAQGSARVDVESKLWLWIREDEEDDE